MNFGILRATALILAACTIAGITTAAAGNVTAQRAAVAAQKPAYLLAQDRLTSRDGAALHQIDLASDAVAAAQKTLADSAGHVLDGDTSRAALEDAIRVDMQLLGVARAEQKIVAGRAKAAPADGQWGPKWSRAAAAVDELSYPAAEHLRPVPGQLAQLTEAVTAAKAAYDAEQARIAAEKAAAYARSHVIHVWTSIGPGETGPLDACEGAVEAGRWLRTPGVIEHSHCGGEQVSTAIGDALTFTGLVTGTYRIDSATHMNGNTQTVYDLPQGYDLLFGTCVTGYSNMIYLGLTRIG